MMDIGPPSSTSTFRHISHGHCRILSENHVGFHLRLPAPRLGHDFVMRFGFLLMNKAEMDTGLAREMFCDLFTWRLAHEATTHFLLLFPLST